MQEGMEVEKKKDQKKNTDLWKQKQEEKNKKIETQGKEGDLPKKADKKKDKQTQNSKPEEVFEKQTPQQQSSKPTGETKGPIPSKVEEKQQSSTVVNDGPKYSELRRIDSYLVSKDNFKTRQYQKDLIKKGMESFVDSKDSIIYLNFSEEWEAPCEQVSLSKFNAVPNSTELVCRYSDVQFFIESRVTKLFVEGAFIFGNSGILAKKGALNIVLLCLSRKIPIIGCCGSWNYVHFQPLSEDMVEEKYGPSVWDKYDWISADSLTNLVLEVGSILPRQTSTEIEQVYKHLRLDSLVF